MTAANSPLYGERTAVGAAIAAAASAIGGLSATSTDADVAAAQGALDTAKAVLAAVTLLPASEVFALQDRIDAAESGLEAIVGTRTHLAQLGAANMAVEAAERAVNALSVASTDAEVSAAEQAIAAAQAAVAAGTLLTPGEAEALSGAIALAEMSLGTVKAAIADRKTREGQRAAAIAAVEAAASAVGGLSATSTDADVAAAERALDAAQAALAAVTELPLSEFRALQDRIDAAGARLEAVRAAIDDYRTHLAQLGAANTAVEAAEMAVNALSVASTDAEVSAAERAIAAAQAAVAAGTLLTPGEAEALNSAIALAETSLGTVTAAIAERKRHEAQLDAVDMAVTAAQAAVGALDRTSTDAAIAAAQALVDAAVAAVSAGTLLTAAERSAADAMIAASMTSLEGVTVEARIHAANSAIEGLTATSTDAEIDAAQAAISAATAALRRVQLLTGPQVNAFQGDIDAAKTALAAKRTQIAEGKTHQEQLTGLNTAVSAAQASVDALDRMSSDAAIAAAQARIDAAEAAVLAGTKLTVEEKEAANATITASRTTLERVTVDAKVHAAQTAVGGLSVASTDADVAAAQAAIDAASAALRNVRLLSAGDALAFRDSIDAAQADLETVKTRIADSKTHDRQLKAVNDAVDAAGRAVSGLSADSTEADADDAATKIQAARDAVAAGTALTAGERSAATATIEAAERTLVTRRADIMARRDDARAMSAALTRSPRGTFDPAGDAAHVVDGGEVSGTDNYERSATDIAPAISGWVGSVYGAVTRDTAGTVTQTDTVVVYTDKAAPKSARYATYFPQGAMSDDHLNPDRTDSYVKPSGGFRWQRWVGVASVSGDGGGVITLSADEAISSADTSRLFDAAALPARGVTQDYLDGDANTPGLQVEFAGSFQGVAGMFGCSATGDTAACTARMSAGGALTFSVVSDSGGAWTFTPASTAAMVPGVQTDADYLDFGYWVENDVTNAADPYTVDAFFRGEAPHDALGSVEGEARYVGKAAGLYARQVYEGNALLDDRSGRFTADVALTAYFSGGAIAPDDENSIGGTISNFMDDGQPIDSGWSVTLNKIGGGAGGGGTGTFSTSDGTFTAGTTAGGGAAGTWSGAFYGDTTQVDGVTPQPGSVAGEFTAGFHNGAVIGAFGARKQ